MNRSHRGHVFLNISFVKIKFGRLRWPSHLAIVHCDTPCFGNILIDMSSSIPQFKSWCSFFIENIKKSLMLQFSSVKVAPFSPVVTTMACGCRKPKYQIIDLDCQYTSRDWQRMFVVNTSIRLTFLYS